MYSTNIKISIIISKDFDELKMSHPRENPELWYGHNVPWPWIDQDALIWYAGLSFLMIHRICCSLQLCICNALQFKRRPFWFFVFFNPFVHCYHRKVQMLFFEVCQVWWEVNFFRSSAPWVEFEEWHLQDEAYNTLGSNSAALIQFFNRFRGEDFLDLVWSREYQLFRLTFNS